MTELEAAQETIARLVEELAQAKAVIASLRHLQRYEGYAKAESDEIGHEVEVQLLKEEISRLRQELEAARG